MTSRRRARSAIGRPERSIAPAMPHIAQRTRTRADTTLFKTFAATPTSRLAYRFNHRRRHAPRPGQPEDNRVDASKALMSVMKPHRLQAIGMLGAVLMGFAGCQNQTGRQPA